MISFYDDISIFERNAGKIQGVETNSARRLLKEYSVARERIKAQLLLSPDNSFTEAKLTNTLLQLDQSIAQLNRQINPTLRSFFSDSTEYGLEDSAREVNALEKKFEGVSSAIDVDAVIESTDPENLLFNQFESSVSAYNENLRNGFQQSLTQSLLQQKSWSQAVWDMESVFNQSEHVLARIVRTELHGIYSNAKLNGMFTIQDKYLPDLMKTIYNPMDSRTADDSMYVDTLKMVVPLDEPFSYTYKGQRRVYMSPPDRPNDRSILVPYRSSYSN
jgi:hypothetical protein